MSSEVIETFRFLLEIIITDHVKSSMVKMSVPASIDALDISIHDQVLFRSAPLQLSIKQGTCINTRH